MGRGSIEIKYVYLRIELEMTQGNNDTEDQIKQESNCIAVIFMYLRL